MPTPIENTLAIILSPENKMRDKTPYVYDIPESNLCWLHNCGSAAKSTLHWLGKDYGNMRKMTTEQLKENQKPAFVLLHEPEYRWWTGIIEWATGFEDYAWFKNEKIMAKGEKESLIKKIQTVELKLRSEAEKFGKDFEKTRAEELDKIKVTVETAINAYARDNNFDLIIRSDGTTLYRKNHLDITEDIISELE